MSSWCASYHSNKLTLAPRGSLFLNSILYFCRDFRTDENSAWQSNNYLDLWYLFRKYFQNWSSNSQQVWIVGTCLKLISVLSPAIQILKMLRWVQLEVGAPTSSYQDPSILHLKEIRTQVKTTEPERQNKPDHRVQSFLVFITLNCLTGSEVYCLWQKLGPLRGQIFIDCNKLKLRLNGSSLGVHGSDML